MMRGRGRRWRSNHDQLLGAQRSHAEASAALGAFARALRQVLQVVTLGVGAWLVIDLQASAGVMIGATILLGRALQPVEHLIGGWRALVGARGAWRRLGERRMNACTAPRVALPAPRRPHRRRAPDVLVRAVASAAHQEPELLSRGRREPRRDRSERVRQDDADSPDSRHLGAACGRRSSRRCRHRALGPRRARPAHRLHAAGCRAVCRHGRENIARFGEVDSEASGASCGRRLAHAHELILRLTGRLRNPDRRWRLHSVGRPRQRSRLHAHSMATRDSSYSTSRTRISTQKAKRHCSALRSSRLAASPSSWSVTARRSSGTRQARSCSRRRARRFRPERRGIARASRRPPRSRVARSRPRCPGGTRMNSHQKSIVRRAARRAVRGNERAREHRRDVGAVPDPARLAAAALVSWVASGASIGRGRRDRQAQGRAQPQDRATPGRRDRARNSRARRRASSRRATAHRHWRRAHGRGAEPAARTARAERIRQRARRRRSRARDGVRHAAVGESTKNAEHVRARTRCSRRAAARSTSRSLTRCRSATHARRRRRYAADRVDRGRGEVRRPKSAR